MELRAFALCALIAGAGTAQAQTFQPYEGQPGKDVVWVPTPRALVEKMLDLAAVTSRDFVVDLGSGDGRLVIAAAGLAEKAKFVQGDMFEADFSQASVLALFLLPANLRRLVPKFLEMPAGTRIVNNGYRIEGWEEDSTVVVNDDCIYWCTAYLYVVPAKLAGAWRLPSGELRFTQEYQALTGTLFLAEGREVKASGTVKGDRVRFTAGLDIYTGRVQGDRMSGEASGAFGGRWTATRLR